MSDGLLWHRMQFAFTITFHYLFPQLTMGLELLIVLFKSLALRLRDESYTEVARFWGRVFALNFAMGVVTGIPMEFQFGTNWARFSRFSGDVVRRCRRRGVLPRRRAPPPPRRDRPEGRGPDRPRREPPGRVPHRGRRREDGDEVPAGDPRRDGGPVRRRALRRARDHRPAGRRRAAAGEPGRRAGDLELPGLRLVREHRPRAERLPEGPVAARRRAALLQLPHHDGTRNALHPDDGHRFVPAA